MSEFKHEIVLLSLGRSPTMFIEGKQMPLRTSLFQHDDVIHPAPRVPHYCSHLRGVFHAARLLTLFNIILSM